MQHSIIHVLYGTWGVCVHAGMRCLSPSMSRWPSWADVFPNIILLPKIEAKTFIMHVSHPAMPSKCLSDLPAVSRLYAILLKSSLSPNDFV